MPKFVDRVGQRYGRLVVQSVASPAVEPSGRSRTRWECICDCGERCTVRGTDLRSGRTQSCGCLHIERTSQALTIHTEARKGLQTVEYRTWAGMIARCTYEKDKDFHLYGGRGIQVCPRWRNSFEAFLADMGRKPSRVHSIDRFPDNDGNYEPGNCRWATPTQQCRNKRKSLTVNVGGKAVQLGDACERFGIPYKTVYARLFRYGWSTERALEIA